MPFLVGAQQNWQVKGHVRVTLYFTFWLPYASHLGYPIVHILVTLHDRVTRVCNAGKSCLVPLCQPAGTCFLGVLRGISML